MTSVPCRAVELACVTSLLMSFRVEMLAKLGFLSRLWNVSHAGLGLVLYSNTSSCDAALSLSVGDGAIDGLVEFCCWNHTQPSLEG